MLAEEKKMIKVVEEAGKDDDLLLINEFFLFFRSWGYAIAVHSINVFYSLYFRMVAAEILHLPKKKKKKISYWLGSYSYYTSSRRWGGRGSVRNLLTMGPLEESVRKQRFEQQRDAVKEVHLKLGGHKSTLSEKRFEYLSECWVSEMACWQRMGGINRDFFYFIFLKWRERWANMCDLGDY